jgi:hypothetical protein
MFNHVFTARRSSEGSKKVPMIPIPNDVRQDSSRQLIFERGKGSSILLRIGVSEK